MHCMMVGAFGQNTESKEDGYINAFDSDKAVWTYYFTGYFQPPFIGADKIQQTIIDGDTVIDGVKWRIIIKDPVIKKGLVRVEGEKVWFRSYPGYEKYINTDHDGRAPNPNYDGSPIVIYDFSLKAGDIVKELVFDSIHLRSLEIMYIDSVVLNDGKKHKLLRVIPDMYSFMEGVGNIGRPPFYMVWPYFLSMYNFPDLLCCHVNGELFYADEPLIDDCIWGTPNEEIEEDRKEYLSQNVPNPVDGSAQISYFLPKGATNASISFYNVGGALVKNVPLAVNEGKGQITISSADFATGVHVYTLTVNGVVLDTKKMMNQ